MFIKERLFSLKVVFFALVFGMLLVPFQTQVTHAAEGTPIQKDVYLNGPMLGIEDLPDEIAVSLYDSETATTPLATQVFPRGKYTLDCEFNKSDGVALGPIARINLNFTNKLNLGADNETKVKEIWVELSANGQQLEDRTQVSDETLVKLLLDSDAVVTTYLTLAYEGDGNPIATIYRDLPLSTMNSSGLTTSQYVNSLFSGAVVTGNAERSLTSPFWEQSGANIYYADGNVGIVTSTPTRDISVAYNSTSGGLDGLPTISVANTHVPTGLTDFSFSSFEFSGGNGLALGEFFADGSGFFLNGTPNVFFRAGLGTAMLLGTNKESRMTISTTGNVGIGLGTTVATNKLDVYGTIRCTELIVTNDWSDFVFEDNYKLPALNEVEDFIAKNRHLPGIPSAAEVKENGVSVGHISSKLLQKVEELTLYVIDLKKENESLKGQLVDIRGQIGSKTN